MSTRDQRSRERVLERLTQEARVEAAPDPGANVDWGAVDAQLFARIETEAKAARARDVRGAGDLLLESPRESRVWLGVAAALAVAAGAVVILAHHPREPERAETSAPGPVSTLVSREGAGTVRVAGHDAPGGTVVVSGDAIETAAAARAIFRREGTAPEVERVRWALEPSSRARVNAAPDRPESASASAAEGALVVTLEQGAVEAEVTPVATGEAFAVDVGGTRIAVHGTHLRVARADDRITVDLSRGVVSIGDAPRAGSTYGELVTAPAHVEFSTTARRASLRLDHAPSSVRAPASLDLPVAIEAPPAALHPPALHLASPPVAVPPAALPPPATAPRIDAPSAPPAVDPNPEATIEHAVAACILARPRSDDSTVTVTSTVTSTLTLTVGDDGLVHGPAQFAPPLPPEVQTCASTTIFRVRFKDPGLVSIPIHVQR